MEPVSNLFLPLSVTRASHRILGASVSPLVKLGWQCQSPRVAGKFLRGRAWNVPTDVPDPQESFTSGSCGDVDGGNDEAATALWLAQPVDSRTHRGALMQKEASLPYSLLAIKAILQILSYARLLPPRGFFLNTISSAGSN